MPSEARRRLLIKLAEQVKGSALLPRESQLLTEAYDRGVGDDRQRITRAISASLGVSTDHIQKRASLDDTDRILQDIENELKKPG
ncbi:MAG: hypothetical protein AB7T27_10135 [Kiritimatiellia bacterium]